MREDSGQFSPESIVVHLALVTRSLEHGTGNQAKWTCLTCDVSLHDKCIQRHKGDNEQGKTHTIIPGFDALLQKSGSSAKVSEPRIDKIIVTGPGVVQSGVVGKFDSTFYVNTYGAGPGHLGVKVEGPKAAFNVKMEPHNETKTTMVCSYQAEEAGDYVITVTWSEKEVHGSPFKVHLKNSE